MARDLVGELISFRGLVYAPINEQGVVYLFGKVSDDLHIYVETVRTEFPDCIGRRFAGRGWEKIGIEFEHKSYNFKEHGHDPKACDMPVVLVCWEDNWFDRDMDLKEQLDQVIELKTIIKDLPNKSIIAPKFDQHLVNKRLRELKEYASEASFKLFEELRQEVKTISDDIFPAVGKTMVSYYSPKWRFMSVFFLQNGLRVQFFLGGLTIDNIKPKPDHPNWGDTYLQEQDEIKPVVATAKRSLELVLEAGKKSMDMTWQAEKGCFATEGEEEIENDFIADDIEEHE